MRTPIVLALLGSLALTASAWSNEIPKARLVCDCRFPAYKLYIANADGSNERELLPGTASSYNASFSADGRWIIFTSDRSGFADIYRVHPDRSGLEQLTHGPELDDQGALSPDGKTLAFVSTREGGTANIWLLDLATGGTTNLTRSTAGNFRPSWSPDGQWIAFSSDRDTPLVRYLRPSGGLAWEQMQLTAIYILRRDGTRLRRLTPLDGIAGTPKWSPDGHQLVYYQMTDVKERYEGRGDGHGRIMVIDLRNGATRTVSSGAQFEESPQFLAAAEIGYLSVEQENGLESAHLAYSSGRVSAARSMESPSWSPGGAAVVYHRREDSALPWAQVLATQDASYELIGGRLFSDSPVAFTSAGDRFFYALHVAHDGSSVRINVASLAAMATHTVSVLQAADPKSWVGALSLSPNEHELAVEIASRARPPLPGRIAFVGTDGSHLHQDIGAPEAGGFPSYSPDGRSIVLRVLGSQQGLRILSLTDGKVRVLTTGADNFPAWSRQANRIAFTRLENNAFEIYTIRPDGSDLRQLTHSRGTDAYPVWSPDGQWLAFMSERRGSKDESIFNTAPQPYGEVFVMRADGSDVRQLTDNRYEERIVAWLPATSRGPGYAGAGSIQR